MATPAVVLQHGRKPISCVRHTILYHNLNMMFHLSGTAYIVSLMERKIISRVSICFPKSASLMPDMLLNTP